jgi:hypothetical protein
LVDSVSVGPQTSPCEGDWDSLTTGPKPGAVVRPYCLLHLEGVGAEPIPTLRGAELSGTLAVALDEALAYLSEAHVVAIGHSPRIGQALLGGDFEEHVV